MSDSRGLARERSPRIAGAARRALARGARARWPSARRWPALAIVRCLPCSRSPRRCWRRTIPTRRTWRCAWRRRARALARHRRARPRHPLAPPLRRARHARHRRAGRSALTVPPVGLVVGCAAGYARRLGRCGADARRPTCSWRFPRLILALACVAALGPGIEHALIAIALDRLAALCAARARRDAGAARARLHRRGAARRRLAGAHRAAPHRAAVPAVADRARLRSTWRA